MPDLLLELFSEEIPARMQGRAAEDLKAIVTGKLVDAGLVYEGARAFVTPRRLALTIQGVPARQQDLKEEKKGPRVGAPENAIQGFLRSAGLSSIDEATIQKDPRKGDFYIALIEKPGRPALDVLAEILPVAIRTFPWPKSMRWGEGRLTWVRPLHSIVATFGPETEEPEVVPFAVDGIAAGATTRGHRFLAPDEIRVKRFDDYAAKLAKAKVVLDPERRKEQILADAKNLAFAQGLELIEDAALLDEVAGLVEWPVVLMGAFDESFLKIPPEVVRTTIRNNQKCFVVRERLPKFEHIVFHEKLGTQAERIARIEKLAIELAPIVRADVEKTRRAAKLAKADLLTEVVGEFPELQGLMGKYYAEAQGEDEAVARACEDHYRPKGPDDVVPSNPVSIAVALADKLDTLIAFWSIDEKPTGSKDPYALRRAALGVIRIVLDNGIRLPLLPIIKQGDLLSFFADRLKVQLRDQGARHDLVDAVFSLEGQDDLVLIVRRVEALAKFLDSEDGQHLLTGTKRAANILRIEEKKDKASYDQAPDPKLYALPEEKELARAIDAARKDASAAVAREDLAAAMSAMAKLRPHVDAFFDKVTVNADDKAVRANRLRLLNEIRAATRAVADFSKIEG